MTKEKTRGKILAVGLAALMIVSVLGILLATSGGSNGQSVSAAINNEVYLVPQDSSVPFCETADVEIRVNATAFMGGQIKILYESTCANVTNWVLNTADFPLGTWESSPPGEEWITFTALEALSGDYLIGTLTIHCVSEEECTTALDFIEDGATGSALFDDTGSQLPATWTDGTFKRTPTLPTVTGKSPVGSDIFVGSAVSVTFSEPMNEASAENAFSIVPDVAGSFSWAGNTLTFDPNDDLAYDTTYNVTVAGTAEDLAGNGLDGNENGSAEGSPVDDYTWSFATEVEVTYYTLTVSCDPAAGGSVALIPVQPPGGYEAGTPVELTATANEDYAFGSWSGDLGGSTNPDIIIMNSNKSVTANFVLFSAPGNVAVMGADPGVESITVSSIDLGEVDTTNMPGDIDPQEAYVVDSTGTGSFTLRFTGITSASQIVIYKVVDSTWTQIPPTAITVINATTIEVTMEVGDPILVFATPTGPPPPVGGDAFLPNRLLLLIPWIALGAAIVAAAVIVARRRRPQS